MVTYTQPQQKKKKRSIKDELLAPIAGVKASDLKPNIANATSKLDKPIQAINEFINPEQKKARTAQEAQKLQAQNFADAMAARAKAQANAQPPAQPQNPTSPEVIRDENGKISGVQLPDGRVLNGLTPSEVRNLINKDNEDRQLPQGALEAGTTRKMFEAQQQAQQAIGQLNAPQQINPSVQLGQGASDLAATVGTSLPSIAAGASGGATIGATGGAFAAGPLGALVGGAIGGVVGGITALLAKISVDRRQATKEAKRVYTDAKNTNTKLLNLANSGSVPPAEIIRAYELNMANIREAERELRNQTRGAVGKQLSGAMDELIDVQYYLEQDKLYRIQLIQALGNPDPSKIYPTDEALNSEELSS